MQDLFSKNTPLFRRRGRTKAGGEHCAERQTDRVKKPAGGMRGGVRCGSPAPRKRTAQTGAGSVLPPGRGKPAICAKKGRGRAAEKPGERPRRDGRSPTGSHSSPFWIATCRPRRTASAASLRDGSLEATQAASTRISVSGWAVRARTAFERTQMLLTTPHSSMLA